MHKVIVKEKPVKRKSRQRILDKISKEYFQISTMMKIRPMVSFKRVLKMKRMI